MLYAFRPAVYITWTMCSVAFLLTHHCDPAVCPLLKGALISEVVLYASM